MTELRHPGRRWAGQCGPRPGVARASCADRDVVGQLEPEVLGQHAGAGRGEAQCPVPGSSDQPSRVAEGGQQPGAEASARWWRCSVQSVQNRSSGRAEREAASSAGRSTPRSASTVCAAGPSW